MSQYISIACVIVAFLAGWVSNGWRLQTDMEKREVAMLKATREKERIYAQEIESLQKTLQEQQNESEKYIRQLRADIASDRLRLTVPVRNCTNTTSSTGEKRAEIDRKTSDDLVAITEYGDNAIRELNSCIDRYNALRK